MDPIQTHAAVAPKFITLRFITALLPALGIIYLVGGILFRTILDPLKGIPGPFFARVSSVEITIASVRGKRAHRLLELHNRYGPIVRIGPNEISIGSWKYYRVIYGNPKTSSKDPSFYSAATFLGLDNIFQMSNKVQHAARRKLGSVPYSLQSVDSLEPLIKEKADLLVERLVTEAASSPSSTADALKLCGLFSFQVVCKAGFARDFFEGTGDDSLALLNAMDGSAMTMVFNMAMPWLRTLGFATHIPGQIGKCYRLRDFWEAKSREMVAHFLANSKETDNYLLTPYMKGTDGFLGRRLVKEEFIEEAMGIMFAGSGTTSTTLAYCLYALSRPENRHIQERLRDELRTVPNGISSIRNLPFLNAVIKETFRLYPTIISTLPRILNEPLTIESHTLKPGTVVGMQNLVHHRDSTVFPEPESFSPERWLASTQEMEGALTPFSIGRRNCIGQNLAWAELYLSIYQVISRLKISLSKDMDEADMEMEDRFNIAPRGKKLMLEVVKI